MNETRKEIIGLIEPYMDKTLSEGCLYFRWNGIEWEYHINKDLYEDDVEMNFRGLIKNVTGHYDITAVLKYVVKNWWWYFDDLKNESINIFKHSQSKMIYKIPVKPLHLYSEQEDKDLLELLKKLI